MAFSYSERFYDEMVDTSTTSAEVIVPLVLDLVAPRSVIDVGCGEGKWLSIFKKQGIEDVFGIDGEWVKAERLTIPEEQFNTIDLEEPFILEKTSDLVISLEVAEHLLPTSADAFVASLTAIAPVILFSAAIPLQGGSHHVNEQWPEYWEIKFNTHGYVAVDPIRRHIWNDQRVSFFYAQNIVMYVKESELPNYPKLMAERKLGHDHPIPLVHPFLFNHYAKRWHAIEPLLWKIPLPIIKWAKRFLVRS